MDRAKVLRQAATLLHEDIKCLRTMIPKADTHENKILTEEIQRRSTCAKNLLDLAQELDVSPAIRKWGHRTGEMLDKIPNAYKNFKAGTEGRGGRQNDG